MKRSTRKTIDTLDSWTVLPIYRLEVSSQAFSVNYTGQISESFNPFA